MDEHHQLEHRLLEHEKACAAVIRGLSDAADGDHLQARGAFVTLTACAAPRLSRTPGEARPGTTTQRPRSRRADGCKKEGRP